MKRRQFLAVTAGLALADRAGAAARHKSALVLGGGGCRGYAHLGVLRVLEREGLRPDLIVGSSAGSLVGVLYAAGLSTERIAKLGEGLTPNLLRDWIYPNLGIFSGAGIARFVRRHIGVRRIETLPMRFAAVATDLRLGERVVLERGDSALAVQASSSAPGLLEPVILEGRLLVDGNIVAPVPVSAARALGARQVAAVDVTFPPDEASLSDPFDALYQGFSILTRKLALEERNLADVALAPVIPEHHSMSAAVIAEHVRAGEQEAMKALPRLREVFAAG
jgi:NTE family protein